MQWFLIAGLGSLVVLLAARIISSAMLRILEATRAR